ncbi:MAG: hypothetical protein ABIR51_01540 [Sphingomicrobium sp.]
MSAAVRRPRILYRPLVALALLCGLLAILFRTQLLDGFRTGFGDRGDAIIAAAILEHWHNVFAGFEPWNRTLYFFPNPDTLGYNDGYLLSGLVYSAARVVFDPFLSQLLVIAAFRITSFVACLVLLRRCVGTSFAVALIGAACFTLANALTLQMVHEQLQAIALLPLLTILLWRGIERAIAGRHGLARWWLGGFALLLASLFLTAFYPAYLYVLFLGIFGLAWAWAKRRDVLARWRDFDRRWAATVAVPALLFGVAIIPFLMTYLPKVAETGQHRFKAAKRFLAQPIDWLMVGDHNLLWGWTQHPLLTAWWMLWPDGRLSRAADFNETRIGLPFLFLGLVIAALWQVRRRPVEGGAPWLRPLAVALLVSSILMLALGPLSPWRAVRWLVPGASGARVVARYQLVLLLPMTIIVARSFGPSFERLASRRPVIAAMVAALLIAEQVNLAPVAAHDLTATRAAFEALPAPPRGCRSFYTVSTRPGEAMFKDPATNAKLPHNVDAMLLSELWHVPTLSGTSTFDPPGWNLAAPLAPDYDGRVAGYALSRGVTNSCRLDARRTLPWNFVRFVNRV